MSMRVAASVFDLDRLSNENFTGDNTPVAQNPNDLANEYGPCNFDVKHNLTISGVTTTPKFHNTGVNLVAGGWQVSPLISYRTGLPFTVTSGTDVSLSGIGQDRPNPVAGVARYKKNFFPATNTLPHNVQWFNPAAFTNPTGGNSEPCGRSRCAGRVSQMWMSLSRSSFRSTSVTGWNCAE